MLTTIQTFLSSWYNLPFTFLVAAGLLLAVLQWAGLDGDEDAGSDMDGEWEVDSSASSETSTSAGQAGFSILVFLGLGRAPLLVTLLLWFGSIGLAGWVLNGLVLRVLDGYPALAFGVVFLFAVGVGSLLSSRLARVIGRNLAARFPSFHR